MKAKGSRHSTISRQRHLASFAVRIGPFAF